VPPTWVVLVVFFLFLSFFHVLVVFGGQLSALVRR